MKCAVGCASNRLNDWAETRCLGVVGSSMLLGAADAASRIEVTHAPLAFHVLPVASADRDIRNRASFYYKDSSALIRGLVMACAECGGVGCRRIEL
ncbi:hypothetical protein [Burkholderia sp. NLJ2]|uniref:hypothetical protein n=1 Tax=Burkholderia sp. NLJ2 TaxID=3090699 RepID=UPI003C6C887B